MNTYKPQPCEAIPGFYFVPGHDDFVINEDGILINIKTNKQALPTYSKTGTYPNFFHGINMLCHLLMIKVFMGPKNGFIVNHLDGDKSNFKLDNLELTTYTGNIVHAYQTGLRSDNIKLLLKDLEDGSIREFYSMNECARFLGVHILSIRGYLDKSKEKVYPYKEKWSIIKKGEEWPRLTNEDVGKSLGGLAYKIAGYDPYTKQLTIYESLGHVASELEVKHGGIGWMLRNHGYCFRKGVWLFYRKDYYGSDVGAIINVNFNYKKPDVFSVFKKKPKPIEVINTLTGNKKVYDSAEQLANELGVTRGAVAKSIWLKGSYKHFMITYS